ncbi:hypothetical protein AURDEDRAFT_178804 [Auricularia subglabra TFB-10046 SS5]|uniref:Uncharacterized protein n=1 Tax=Auricularia subglabra (strain TFB-10046 / SS5) TaxID=717982 RepID=J0WIR5_AURST|nr:hypothetical protein AURDEDRAFT_178804 [Auricularia subglabra TFB-10046 SS5]
MSKLTFTACCGPPGNVEFSSALTSAPCLGDLPFLHIHSTTLSLADCFPSPEDLKPVPDGLKDAFSNGSRSAVLKVKRELPTCHSQKTQLFRNSNWYRQRIIDCTARFNLHRLTGRVHGLATYLTWHDLSALLGENYVWDDVIDARGELIHARLARLTYPIDFSRITRIWPPSVLLALRHLIQSREITELVIVRVVHEHAMP